MSNAMKRVAALAIAALAVAGVAAGLAFAGGGGKTQKTATTAAGTTSSLLDDIAAELGIPPAKLKDATVKALEKRVDAAVAAGQLTKDQGDALKTRIETGADDLFGGLGKLGRAGAIGGFWWHGFGGPGFFWGGGLLQPAADYLGLTRDQLMTKLMNGQSLADVAKATQGKSVDGLEQAILDAAKKQLDARGVAADTQKQVLDKLKAALPALVDNTWSGWKGGFHGRFHTTQGGSWWN
jgi:hypothetical protein